MCGKKGGQMTTQIQNTSTKPDSSQISTACIFSESAWLAIIVVLVIAFVSAALAVEIELLDSGALVVVMPE